MQCDQNTMQILSHKDTAKQASENGRNIKTFLTVELLPSRLVLIDGMLTLWNY